METEQISEIFPHLNFEAANNLTGFWRKLHLLMRLKDVIILVVILWLLNKFNVLQKCNCYSQDIARSYPS